MHGERARKINQLRGTVCQEALTHSYRSKEKDRKAAGAKLNKAKEELKAATDSAEQSRLRKKVKELENEYDAAADTGD